MIPGVFCSNYVSDLFATQQYIIIIITHTHTHLVLVVDYLINCRNYNDMTNMNVRGGV